MVVIVRLHLVLASIVILALAACAPTAIDPQPGSATAPVSSGLVPGTATPRTVTPAPVTTPVSTASSGPVTGRWLPAAPLGKERRGFGSVLLSDGSVLVVGDHWDCRPGGAEPGSEEAERYDPVADSWAEADPLNKPRKGFAMVPTLDGGAMVIGGLNADDVPFSSTKIFDPVTGSWSDGPLLDSAIGQPAAVALDDGRILVGDPRSEETNAFTSTSVSAPSRSAWDEGPTIEGLRINEFLALSDGRLIAHGDGFELPMLLAIADTGGAEGWADFPAPDFVAVETLVALPDGGILAFGWDESELGWFASGRVQRYEPATNRWREASPIPTPRSGFQVTTLADGRVMVSGGVYTHGDIGGEEIYRTTELYNPATDSWTVGPDLVDPRAGGAALTLADGSVLVLGGTDQLMLEAATPFCPPPLRTVERLYPTP